MSSEAFQIGAAAVSAAMARARAHFGTAAIAAALVPLSAVAAHAVIPPVTVGVVTTVNSGVVTDTYTVTNSPSAGSTIDEIVIPEFNAGDLTFAGSGLPSSWTATEMSTSPISGAGLKPAYGTAGAYIELFGGSGSPIGYGKSLSFSATAPVASTVNAANFGFGYLNGSSLTIDPPIPNTQTAVPEPSSFALFGAGLLGLFGFKRRRKA